MAPFVRIILHMLGAILISMGHVSEDFVRDILSDPELIGGIVLAITWTWYYMARKFNWKT